ncbi:RING finger domain-containing protein [Endozoicomonas sp. ONNA2]|uniref:RING finger domain-containing protein n=1 Tax=Endozoicomonas sp. ONNA2 TaxID=2828741 RepID=UPI002148E1C0|nr:RING finger domain-containing protein [Endozoicomonas sp. ONNA2]
METKVHVTNKPTRVEPDFTPASKTEIVLLNGHRLTYTDSVKNRMTDKCPICQETLFSEEKAIIERPCQHFEHQECFLRRITAENQPATITTCPICKSQKPHNKEYIFYNRGTDWLHRAERKCEREDCLYIHKHNDEAEAPGCPYPYSMFPDHESATGFLHQYGKLVDKLIVTQLGFSGIKAFESGLENITNERKNDMERKYGKENDLKKLVQQFDENHGRAEDCMAILEREFNQGFEPGSDNIKSFRHKTNSKTDESKSIIRDRIREAKEALLSNRAVSKHLIDLRYALENDREHCGGWGSPEVSSMISLSNPNPHELIPGLAESTDMDFALVRTFTVDGVNHPFEIRVDAKKINESKSVNEAVANVINCVRCELMMSKLMKNYPAYFDDKTKVYLKTPFDYWGDKIEIVCSDNKEQPHAIKLSKVFDFEKKEFNFTVFLNAVDQFKGHGINRHDLRSGSLDQMQTGQSTMIFDDSGDIPSFGRGFRDIPSFGRGFRNTMSTNTILSTESVSRSTGLLGTCTPSTMSENRFTISHIPPAASSLFGASRGLGSIRLTMPPDAPFIGGLTPVGNRPRFTGPVPSTALTVLPSREEGIIGFDDIF